MQRLATVLSRAQNGLAAELVEVEVHLAPGLPGLSIVGLPEAAVRESRDRVRAALQHCGFEFPNRRITVNLAPADLPKEGGRFDLPIALGILIASEQLRADALAGCEVLGELSLSGQIRAVRAVLPAALQCSKSGHRLLVPEANRAEALLTPGLRVHSANHLGALCTVLHKGPWEEALSAPVGRTVAAAPDLRDVRGQHLARRALEIAAAGGHSLLMCGPPGSGKSMLAARLPGLLPPMDEDEALEVAAVASIASGGFDPADWGRRPYRSPHHSASAAALVGGGAQPRPGEITLAHRGVLFLDELPEFARDVLEALREPLEAGKITISRAASQCDFPAQFQLVAAMNPCPCGHAGDESRRCRCTPDQIARYAARLSGPLLDRIDLQISVPRVPATALLDPAPAGEDSAAVRARVVEARQRQQARGSRCNAQLSPEALEREAPLDEAGRELLRQATQRLDLSARAHHRLRRVARTIADLAGRDTVSAADLAEAVRYRELPMLRGGAAG